MSKKSRGKKPEKANNASIKDAAEAEKKKANAKFQAFVKEHVPDTMKAPEVQAWAAVFGQAFYSMMALYTDDCSIIASFASNVARANQEKRALMAKGGVVNVPN